MSPRDSTHVLKTLQLLLEAPRDSLRHYKHEVLAAIQKLQSSIDDQSPASSAAPCHTPGSTTDNLHRSSSSTSQRRPQNSLEPAEAASLSLASNDAPDQRNPHAPNSPQQPYLNTPQSLLLPSSVENVLTRLIKNLEKTEEFLSQPFYKAVRDEPLWVTDDPRITDIEVAGGSKKPAHTKFRRGLSQRSLAMEFDNWERSNSGTSRVCDRAANPSVKPSRKPVNIQSFLEANKHRFKNLAAARDGIEYGIKLLVCEKLLGGTGFSALLIFQFDSFRSVKYPELKDLKKAIEKQKSIKNLARLKAGWLSDCQNKYNKWYSGFARPSNKRHRQGSSFNQQKRLKAREPHGTPQGNPTQATHGSMISQYLRIDGQAEAPQNDIRILGDVDFDPEAPSLRPGVDRTCDTIPSVLTSSDTCERIPLPWTPGRIPSSLPQAQHQSLETYHPRSQPQANYNLASLAADNQTSSNNGEMTSYDPLSQPTHYSLASLAADNQAPSNNGEMTSYDPLLQQPTNYSLLSLAAENQTPSNDGEMTSYDPLLQRTNYSLESLAANNQTLCNGGEMTSQLQPSIFCTV